MEEKELLKRYVVQPSIKLFAGIKVEESTEFVAANDDDTVKQTFKDGRLTTEINRDYGDKYKTYEKATLVQEVPVGTVLVWSEETGYIIPNYVMVEPEEAISQLQMLKGEPADDTVGDEEKGS